MTEERREVGVRHYILVIALVAIFIGLGTVVGEALVPRSPPPRGTAGRLALPGAMALSHSPSH